MAIYQLKSVDVGYTRNITLRNVSLSIKDGEKVALLGKSGAGKSTLLNYLYDQPPAAINDTVYLPQKLGLVEPLSIFHNIYIAQLHRHPAWYNLLNLLLPQAKQKAPIQVLLDKTELQEPLLTAAKHLSGGQQQRLAICRTLHHGGKTLLADEPTASLDEQQSKAMLKLLCDSFNTAVIALHDIDLALSHFDRIIGLKNSCVYLNEKTDKLTPELLLCLYQ